MAGFEDFLGKWNITVIDSPHFATRADIAHRSILGTKATLRQRLGHVAGMTENGVEVILNDLDPIGGAVGSVYKQEPRLFGSVHLKRVYDGRGSLTGVITIITAREQDPTALYVDLVKIGDEEDDLDVSSFDPKSLGPSS